MASVFKRKRTIKGVATVAKQWTAQWTDADGKVCRQTAFTDKALSLALAMRLEKEAKAGIQAQHQRTPLADHLDAYELHLNSLNRSDKHVRMTKKRIQAILTGCRFDQAADIRESDIEKWLKEQRTKKAFGIKTSNYYGRDFKSFLKWMTEESRIESNPIRRLRPLNADAETKERRALDDEGFAMLIQAAATGEPFRNTTGKDRAMLYIIAANSGFRVSELVSLTAASFNFDTGTVRCRAAHSKRRRNDTQPLPPNLVPIIQEWMKDRKGVVWPGTWHERAAKMLRADLASARAILLAAATDEADRQRREESKYLCPVDETGANYDFHSLRHQYISGLARAGVPVKVAQTLARHSTITLTMDRYTHLVGDEVADAMKRLPAIQLPDELAPNGSENGTQKWTQKGGVPSPQLAPDGTSDPQEVAEDGGSKALQDNDFAFIDACCQEMSESTPDRNRTCNLRIRSPLLYPVELRARMCDFTDKYATLQAIRHGGLMSGYACGYA